MPIHPRLQSRMSFLSAAGASAALWFSTGPVAAGFLDFLLPPPAVQASAVHVTPARSAPPGVPSGGSAHRMSAGSSPSAVPGASPGGPAVAFCVRLCDGRFFPVAVRTGATPIQVCSALCPAARTRIFHGPEIAQARAADGTRYADLDSAFLYRKTLVPGCSCNGKDAFGTAPVDIGGDPTLRPGDLIATGQGLIKSAGPRAPARRDVTLADRTRMQGARQKLATAAPTR